jgi:hypothetical protein
MCVVEIYPCQSVTELHIKEQEYIDLADKKCNSYRSFTSEKEKKEQQNERSKRFYINNTAHHNEYCKRYRENNVGKIKEQRENNKEKTKEYTRNNRERINEQQNERRRKNKEQNTTV